MAICDEGYLCEICGQDVSDLTDSDLYLRYILGEVEPERLDSTPERHLRCNPALAQFIVHPHFPPLVADGLASKAGLDPEFVAEEEARVSRAYDRLLEIPGLGLTVPEYPLPEICARWSAGDSRSSSFDS